MLRRLFADDFFESSCYSFGLTLLDTMRSDLLSPYIMKSETKDGALKLTLEIPGYGNEDLAVSYKDSFLIIKTRNMSKEDKKFIPIATYFAPLLDKNTIQCKLKHGILTITAEELTDSDNIENITIE